MRTTWMLGFTMSLLLNSNIEALELGGNLPPLSVKSPGEIHIDGKEVFYKPWNSMQMERKPHVLQHIAGTMKASKINKSFQDALNDSTLDRDHFEVVSVVDLKQSMWGTRGFVKKELVKNKKKYMGSSIIADERGQGLEAWGLKEKGHAVIVLNGIGEIKYVKDGKLSDEEINSVLELLKSLIANAP
ncbi:MAG: YtfJ family protein [Pseudomonadales bacterium]